MWWYYALYGLAYATLSLSRTVIATNNAQTLANAVVGTGNTLTGYTFTSASVAGGTVINGPEAIGSGIILSSGKVSDDTNAKSVFASTNNGAAGSSLCAQLLGPNGQTSNTHDAAVLGFDFVLAEGNSGIAVKFIFASEEYPQYVGSAYNDVSKSFSTEQTLLLTAPMRPSPSTVPSSPATTSTQKSCPVYGGANPQLCSTLLPLLLPISTLLFAM